MTMQKFQLLSICFLACYALLFTACSDDDEPCINSQRPDFSVSFFEDGNNNPIKETKSFLPVMLNNGTYSSFAYKKTTRNETIFSSSNIRF